MAGRKKIAPTVPDATNIIGNTLPEDAATEIALRGATAAYTDERDVVNQLLGQAQMAEAFSQFSRTVRLSKLAHVKETKLYRALSGKKMPNGSVSTGTWDDFCALLGHSADKVDLDLQNLRAFGEEALESMSRMGIGYRELRQFRQLPLDSKEALIEAAKSGDKDGLLDLAEELIARQTKEKAALAAEVNEARADIETKESRAADREREIDRLQSEVSRLKRERAKATPNDVAKALREAAMVAAMQVRADIAADGYGVMSLHAAIKELRQDAAAGEEGEHDQFLGGLIGDVMAELRRVRDMYDLPIVNDHGAPDWLAGA